MIEFSHNKLISKIQPVATRKKNTIRKERTYNVPSIQRESGNNGTIYIYIYILGKSDINKRGKKPKKRVTIGAPADRRTIERRAAASTKEA